jgi:ketosteroid isomerase-like protein
MTTKDTIQSYFQALEQKKGWEAYLSEAMIFTSYVSPIRRVMGKAAYLDSTRRFFSMITSMELRELIVEGERACALTRYELQPPAGKAFSSDVAEILTVKDGKIERFRFSFLSKDHPNSIY